MNDISSKLEKCFSEKRQSLIDFYSGVIKALDQMIEMNKLPLSTIVFRRLRDELKQEFDDKIKTLDSLPHDMTKGIPRRYYVELDDQLKSQSLYRTILADSIGYNRILSNLKVSLALTEFEEKAGEEVLYKVIQIKRKLLFYSVQLPIKRDILKLIQDLEFN